MDEATENLAKNMTLLNQMRHLEVLEGTIRQLQIKRE